MVNYEKNAMHMKTTTYYFPKPCRSSKPNWSWPLIFVKKLCSSLNCIYLAPIPWEIYLISLEDHVDHVNMRHWREIGENMFLSFVWKVTSQATTFSCPKSNTSFSLVWNLEVNSKFEAKQFWAKWFLLKKKVFWICIYSKLDASCNILVVFVFQTSIRIHSVTNIMWEDKMTINPWLFSGVLVKVMLCN